MCIFTAIQFIFETSKTVEIQIKIIYYDTNPNLILIKY